MADVYEGLPGEDEDPEATGGASMDGAEQLTDQSSQYWALGLGCVALPLLLWAQSVPLSCVYVDEETAMWPKSCKQLEGGSQLRLEDFCLKSCMSRQTWFFVMFLGFALSLQSLVVILNHGGCNHFFKCALSIDFQRQTENLEQQLEEASNADSSMWWKGVKHIFKKVSLRIMKSFRDSAAKSSTRRVMLTPRVLVRFSQMSLAGAICAIGMLVTNNISAFSISLECGNDKKELRYTHSWIHIIIGHVLVLCILVVVILLQFQANYSVQVKMKQDPQQKIDVAELKNQFFTKGGAHYVKKESELKPVYKQRLKKMWLRQLKSIEHDGFVEKPEEAFEKDEWHESDKVILHFGLRKPMAFPFAENRHRIAAITSCFCAAICFTCSSQLCWLCVKGVKVVSGVTVLQMETYLHLLGACGRHSPIGTGSLLGAIMLFAACIIQGVLWKLTDPQAIGSNTPGNYSECLKAIRASEPDQFQRQQLWVKLFSEVLSNVIIDVNIYTQAGAEPPEIWSYVWVKKDDSAKDSNEVIQCVNATADRKLWQRSAQPKKVKLDQPSEGLGNRVKGLVRDDYGFPVLGVICENGKEQMIPLQFVAGGPTAWLNLGRKGSWENLSGGLAFGAFLIVLAEIIFSFLYDYGRFLSSCDDIHNTQCTYYAINIYKEQQPVTFRRTLGTWVAMVGCVIAFVACLCMRVANQEEAGKVSGFCTAYMGAVCFTMEKAMHALAFTCTSLWSCVRAACKKHCCPGKTRTRAQGPYAPLPASQ